MAGETKTSSLLATLAAFKAGPDNMLDFKVPLKLRSEVHDWARHAGFISTSEYAKGELKAVKCDGCRKWYSVVGLINTYVEEEPGPGGAQYECPLCRRVSYYPWVMLQDLARWHYEPTGRMLVLKETVPYKHLGNFKSRGSDPKR